MDETPGRGAVVRVVVVDDHPVVRRGLAALLGTLDGVEVVGEAVDGASAVRETLLLHPDVVLMDLAMPGMDGVEATRRIRAAAPGTAVLVLTMFDDDATVTTALAAGARGYLLKGAEQEEIARAIAAVVAGEAILGAPVAQRMLGRLAGASTGPSTGLSTSPSSGPAVAPSPLDPLTARERDVLDLLAAGRRTASIAAELHLSPKTVSNNLTAVFAKLGVPGAQEAIVLAREHGLGRRP
ncbi:response regulator transcription factor [Kineosporia sp. A_224]|uniref:response regulator transcription factor n=1 Tax=Kineosporia sp. A_224 TaxID=1962180 RepID=UPI001E360C48|nr:response regulator transcription factor [Kineosporia sp. A_224]